MRAPIRAASPRHRGGGGHSTGRVRASGYRPAPRLCENPTVERTFTDLQLLAGILLVALLAVAGSQARFLRLQRALGIEQLLASSFLFLPLGMLLSEAGVGLITPAVVREMEALVTLGLGVLGLLLGVRLEARKMDGVARTLLLSAGVVSVFTILLVGVPLFFLLEIVAPLPFAQRATAAALLGCAAALSSGRLLDAAARTDPGGSSSVTRVADYSAVAGVLAAGVLLALLAPPGTISGLERLLAVASIGVVGGLATWLLANETRDQALRTALLLGMLLVTAGTASHLQVPPVAATLVAGLTIGHLPGRLAKELRENLLFLEAPLTVVLLVIAGAALRVPSAAALVITAVYLVLRTAGKILGGLAASRVSRGLVPRNMGLALLPSSAVALGLALDFHTGTRGQLAEAVMTTALLGGLLSETAGVWTTRLVARAVSASELARTELPAEAPIPSALEETLR